LRFFDLREVSLPGWGTTNTGDLLVERKDGTVRFQCDCPTARLTGAAGYFDITGITAYIKGTPNQAMDLSRRSAANLNHSFFAANA
jgi:hypothetical protein